MTTGETTRFEELTKLAIDFVTTKKGWWDHTAWMDFISNLQAKGFDISGDMQANLGNLLEAMKQFYAAAASTESVENAVKVVVSDSVTFVKQHQGVWGHSEWEDFVKTVERTTLSLSEGTTAYLGGVLESIRALYALSPVAVMQKRLAAGRAQTPPAASRPAAAAEEKPETKSADTKVSEKAKETKTAKVTAEPLSSAPKQQTETPPAASRPAAATEEKSETKPATAEVAEKAKETKAAKVATEPPIPVPKKDDLTAIGGIGPVLAKKLNGEGIFSYAQIAALSDGDIERLEKIIRFPGRIKRDNWIGQAQALSRR